MTYPPDHPPTLPIAIEYPIVPNTPAGVEELEEWRHRQLVRIGVAWAVPFVSLGVTMVLDLVGLRFFTGLAGLVTACSGACAPGLTVVYLLRRRKASQLAEDMPRLPRASLRLGAGRGEGAGGGRNEDGGREHEW